MATITAAGNGKPKKTMRNVPESRVELICDELEDSGYTRITVTDRPVSAASQRKTDRARLNRKYQAEEEKPDLPAFAPWQIKLMERRNIEELLG
jgi:hypothetical protein